MTKKEKDLLAATSRYIVATLDAGDWEAMGKVHAYCSSCPSRQGAVLDLHSSELDYVCAYCPLRPLQHAILDLALRKRKRTP